MPETVVVVNLASQGGRLGRRWTEMAAAIRRHLPFEELRTRAPGDASRLAREALIGGATRIVAIGGDGTISEVVNGFFDGERPVRPGAALGVLPFGTGSDFARTLHMPRDVHAAARVLARGLLRRIDLGLLELTGHDGGRRTRIFANVASFGISGVVDQLVNASPKVLGRLSFILATAHAAMRYRNRGVRMVFDADEGAAVHATIHTVAVANGRYFGGGMHIAPNAALDDGRLDVVVLGDLGRLDLLLHGWRVYTGSHLRLDHLVSVRRVREARAEPLDGTTVQIDADGENVGRLPAAFRVLPAALDLVVPG